MAPYLNPRIFNFTMACMLCLFAGKIPAEDIFVPGDYPGIQPAINHASNGDTVWVSDGTYIGPDNRDMDFSGKAITVRSINGPQNCTIDCEGSVSTPHRAFFFHNGEGYDSVVEGFRIINGYVFSHDSSYMWSGGAFACYSQSSPTIKNCILLNNTAMSRGGAIYCSTDCNPMIRDCSIEENQAIGESWTDGDDFHYEEGQGGGIACFEASPIITNCTISDNSVTDALGENGGGIFKIGSAHLTIEDCIISGNSTNKRGGGIYALGKLWLTNCVIENNTAEFGGGTYLSSTTQKNEIIGCSFAWNQASSSGGGLHCRVSQTKLIACEFTNNTAVYVGGGIYHQRNYSPEIWKCLLHENTAFYGGGIYGQGVYGAPHDPRPFIDSQIMDNIATLGGGIYMGPGCNPDIRNCIISNNEGGGIYCDDCTFPIKNCLFTGNTTAQYGAGVYCVNNSALDLSNCTFAGNSADIHGGSICCYDSAPTVINMVLWNNLAPEGPQIWIGNISAASTLTIGYSDVEGGLSDVFVESGSTLNWGSGMIDANPLFVTGAGGDYYLMQSIRKELSAVSPCVDSGEPGFEMIRGTTRINSIQDEDIIDMGYHYTPCIPSGQSLEEVPGY